jgi:hypothetical protein
MADTAEKDGTPWHEFTEDVADGSMCICGVPALTHAQVFPPRDTAESDAGRPVVIDITGGPLSPEERAIHAKYQSDDPHADYYDPCIIPLEQSEGS